MWFKKIAVQILEKNKKTSYLLKKMRVGKSILEDDKYIKTLAISEKELAKKPSRSEVINFLMSMTDEENYLEIGVRNVESNFAKIKCTNKFSVDPGIESEINSADFKMISDVFFDLLKGNKLSTITNDIKFDLIFIDGLHLSRQVEKDILNSLKYIKNNGFIVLHDCNPPTEYHQREDYYYRNSPANILWNGTTWKAFYKYRHCKELYSICFDTDWGVGVFSKQKILGLNNLDGFIENEFYEFDVLDKNRVTFLNLSSFDDWAQLITKNRIH